MVTVLKLEDRSDLKTAQKRQAKRSNWKEKYTSKFFYAKFCDTFLTI